MRLGRHNPAPRTGIEQISHDIGLFAPNHSLRAGDESAENISALVNVAQRMGARALDRNVRPKPHKAPIGDYKTEWGANIGRIIVANLKLSKTPDTDPILTLPESAIPLVLSRKRENRPNIDSAQALACPGTLTLVDNQGTPIGIGTATGFGIQKGLLYGLPAEKPGDRINNILLPDSLYDIDMNEEVYDMLASGRDVVRPVSDTSIEGQWTRFSSFGMPPDIKRVILEPGLATVTPWNINAAVVRNHANR